MKNRLIAFCLLWLATACAPYDTIDDRKMEAILSEALLTNAIATREAGYADVDTYGDSIDYYTPILNKYDHTLEDFRGTIREMATRKSNPLAEIFTRVNKNIDSLAEVAEYRYNVALRHDSTVLAYYADTLHYKDTTVRGSLAKIRIAVSKPKIGTYRLKFAYRSSEDYRIGAKSVTFRTKAKGSPDQRNWIDRSVRDTAQFSANFKLLNPADTLEINFTEPIRPKREKGKPAVRDTSFVQNFRLIYTPMIEKARRDYALLLYRQTEFLKLILPHAQDSLPLPFRR